MVWFAKVITFVERTIVFLSFVSRLELKMSFDSDILFLTNDVIV